MGVIKEKRKIEFRIGVIHNLGDKGENVLLADPFKDVVGWELKPIHNLGNGGGVNANLEFRGRGACSEYSELGGVGVVKKEKTTRV